MAKLSHCTTDDLRRWIPSDLPAYTHAAERLMSDELPAAVDEFLSRLPKRLTGRRRRRRLLTTVTLLGVLAAVAAAVWAATRIPTWQPDGPTQPDPEE